MTSLEAWRQIVELAKKHSLCSRYTCRGTKLIGLNGNFCHVQAMDDVQAIVEIGPQVRGILCAPRNYPSRGLPPMQKQREPAFWEPRRWLPLLLLRQRLTSSPTSFS